MTDKFLKLLEGVARVFGKKDWLGKSFTLTLQCGIVLMAGVFVTDLPGQNRTVGSVDLHFSSTPPDVTLPQLLADLGGKGVLLTAENEKVPFRIIPLTPRAKSLRGTLTKDLTEPAQIEKWEIRLAGQRFRFCSNSPLKLVQDGPSWLATATFEVKTAWQPGVDSKRETSRKTVIYADCSAKKCTNDIKELVAVSDDEPVTLELHHAVTDGQWILPVEITHPQYLLRMGYEDFRGNFKTVKYEGNVSRQDKTFIETFLKDAWFHVYNLNKARN